MLRKAIVLTCFLHSVCCGQHWPNPENQMLTDSMSSFFYYSNNNSVPFSDPQSLRDTNYRSQLSDNYHDQSEYEIESYRQAMLMRQQQYNRLYNRNKPQSYNPNYKLHYLHRKNLK